MMWLCKVLSLLALLQAASAAGTIKGPPTAETKELTKVARLGEEVRLTCPMSGFPVPIVSWTKDKETITSYAWVRFKPVKKSLRIKDVTKEDTGIYICKGTNGFGSEEIRIDLIVIDPSEFPNLGDGELPDVAPPVFTEETLELRQQHTKETGENFRLSCEALGKPEPDVTWFRNHAEFVPADGSGGNGASSKRKGKAVLNIKNLILADSGTYSCVAKNMIGQASRNFSLKVQDSSHHPVLPSGPENTTVEIGSPALLECKVQSPSTPNIKWLKKLENNSKEDQEDIFDLGEDQKFRVIQNNAENIEKGNNEYVNKLLIPDATEADAGMYYCFVTNTIGYKYKNAYLTVVPRKTMIPNNSAGFSNDPVLILVVCIAVFALLILLFIAACCVRRRQKRPSAESPEVQENLMRQHQQQLKPVQQPILPPPQLQQQQQQMPHPHQYIYQQQQYQASLNNNRKLEQPLPPPPPPPPSMHGDSSAGPAGSGGSGSAASNKWGSHVVYPPMESKASSYKGGSSSVYSQNQYEVPHVMTARGSNPGVGSSASSRYPGSLYGQQQQQPMYPYMGQQQQHYNY